jgi:thiamine-phosphate pyrophosphorylase
MTSLPRLYPILDAGALMRAGVSIEGFARDLRDAGVRFLQYRDKDASDSQLLERAALVRSVFPSTDSCLILNDRVALVKAACFDGVHVGQEDMSPARARSILGREGLIGVSTHNLQQLLLAGDDCADYVAVGPVFQTSSKENPDPLVGLEGVRSARQRTSHALVAIGGITRSDCRAVLDAGADSVAVISDLLPRGGKSTRQLAEEFLYALENPKAARSRSGSNPAAEKG